MKKLNGVTLDTIDNINDAVIAIEGMGSPWVRLVIDQGTPLSDYVKACEKLWAVEAEIMIQICDSYSLKKYSLNDYKILTTQLMSTFSRYAECFEVGNEINGEWCGDPALTWQKVALANQIIKDTGGKTALTLYYNHGADNPPINDIWTWTSRFVKSIHFDLALFSFYPDDVGLKNVNWESEFSNLAHYFPYSALGFGEVGTPEVKGYSDAHKVELMKQFYTMDLSNPMYIGGVFWWYFAEECVPISKPLFKSLKSIVCSQI